MTIIMNKKALLSHGNRSGRRIALNIIEHALRAVDTNEVVRKTVLIYNEKLIVDQLEYDLARARTYTWWVQEKGPCK